MNDGSVFLIVWTFGWVILLIVIWQLRARSAERRRERIHQERMVALEKGIPLPELPDYDEKPGAAGQGWLALRLNPKWPLGVGAIFVMLGIGVAFTLAIHHDQYYRQMSVFGLIGVFLGIGLWLHYFLTRR
jgi:hypothetical protein